MAEHSTSWSSVHLTDPESTCKGFDADQGRPTYTSCEARYPLSLEYVRQGGMSSLPRDERGKNEDAG